MSLTRGDAVTIRVPHYHLTLANIRCIAGSEDDVIILLNKVTSKFRFGPRIKCGSPLAKA